MGKIVTLGEIMLRLSTPGNTRFVQSDSFDVVYGGGEANVAVSCANYGHEAYFVTKLPKHEIGQSAVNALRKYGVKTDYIARGGDRVGIYYLETGASMRPSKVIYDRAHSAIAEADPCDFDFDAIMEGADWFHWSGITPAISDKAAELYRDILRRAETTQSVAVRIDRAFSTHSNNHRRNVTVFQTASQDLLQFFLAFFAVIIGEEHASFLLVADKAVEFLKKITAFHGNAHVADHTIQLPFIFLAELHNFLYNILIHINFDYHRISLCKDLVPFFLQGIQDRKKVWSLRNRAGYIAVVIKYGKPGSHSIGDCLHIFSVYFMILQLMDDVRTQCRVIYNTKKCGAQLKIGNVLHHVPAYSAMNIFYCSCIPSVRNINILRKPFDINKYCS